jgi:hypothetical protein
MGRPMTYPHPGQAPGPLSLQDEGAASGPLIPEFGRQTSLSAPPEAPYHSKGRGGAGVVWGPLWLPWGGVGPLAQLLQVLLAWGRDPSGPLWLPS